MKSETMPGRTLLPIIPFLVAVQSAVAGSVLILADMESKTGTAGQQIYEQLSLLGCCVIGSAAGAFMAIGTGLGNKSLTAQSMCLQFGSSQLAGMCFTPMIMRYAGFTLTPDFVIGSSALVAVTSVTTLQQISKLWLSTIAKKLGVVDESKETNE